MKGIKKLLSVFVLLFGTCGNIVARENGVQFNVQGDIVSSYVWRGMYQSGAAFQPTLGLCAGNFSFTAWGSVDFTGQGHKEADITASYSIAGLTVSLADLWWAGQSGIKNDHENGRNYYFDFDKNSTDHIVEAGLSYVLPVERFPLSVSWYTMLWGGDKKLTAKGELKQAYSTYLEAAYPFTVKGVDLVAAIGCSPWKSQTNYYNDRFAVTNVYLKATKVLGITDKFSIPIFVQTIWNPDREDVHFVLGITFR